MSVARSLAAGLRRAAGTAPIPLTLLLVGAGFAGASPVIAGKLGELLFGAISQAHAGIEPEKAKAAVRLVVAASAGLLVLGLLMRPFQRMRFERLSQAVGDDVTARILATTSTLDLDQTQRPEYLDLVHRIQAEAPSRAFRMVDGLLRLIRGTVGLLCAAFALAPLGAGWALLAVAVVPGALLRQRHQRDDHAARAERAVGEREAAYRAALLGSAAHAKDLRIFGAGPALLEAWRTLAGKAAKDRLSLRGRHAVREAAADLLVVGTGLALAWVALGEVLEGRAAPASLALRFAAIQAATSALSQLSAALSDMSGHARHLDDLDRLLATKPLASGDLPPPALPAEIRLDGVAYRYPGAAHDALADVSLEIPAGSVVAVRGPNGAGKTTLLLLLAGLVRPTRGTLRVGHLDLAALDPSAWRRGLGVAWQDHARFELPVRDVIGLGDPALTRDDARLRRAAEAAGLGPFLDGLPEGLDTRVGRRFEGGKEPSAGLWQRLSLARAFAREAPYLLLDEPSAPLDAEAEAALASALAAAAGRRTVIVVTHRPKLVEPATLVIDVVDGRATLSRRAAAH